MLLRARVIEFCGLRTVGWVTVLHDTDLLSIMLSRGEVGVLSPWMMDANVFCMEPESL